MPDNGSSPLVLFGGSFDPVHRGHLRAAAEAAEQLQGTVYLLPCHIPPHKALLHASAQQRQAMLELAIADYPQLAVDTWELRQPRPSYTVETLQRYRARLGEFTSLVFVMGWDAFQSLPSWYDWRRLTELANLAVWPRPGYETLSDEMSQWLQTRQCTLTALRERANGGVAFLNTTPVAVSSTELRRQLAAGGQAEHPDIPAAVWHYIHEHGLYCS